MLPSSGLGNVGAEFSSATRSGPVDWFKKGGSNALVNFQPELLRIAGRLSAGINTVIQHSEAQFVDRGWQKTLPRLGIVPALDGDASAMPPDAGVSKQVDRVSGIVTHTP